MSQVATTKMSSRGQVVIPEAIRERLSLAAGSQFVVIGEGDTIVFKALKAPPLKKFRALVAKAEKMAKQTGFKKADLDQIIEDVRENR